MLPPSRADDRRRPRDRSPPGARANGWLIAPSNIGDYGVDYSLRAVVAKIGLGALPPREAMYPMALTDRLGQPLVGAKRYVLHLAAPPPVDAFWSLTMYAADMLFVPNAIDRYVINDRSALEYNADGSLDVYVQSTPPTDPHELANWLPAPAGAFRLMLRAYYPQDAIVNGPWSPPTLLPCLSSFCAAP